MAKMNQGIFGGLSGTIGNVVGSSWKGIDVLKSKPVSVANPQTAGQVAQRTRFTNVVNFAVSILSVFIKPLWDRFAIRQSGFNAFVSENIALFDSVLPGTFSNLVTSKGKMSSTSVAPPSGTNGSANVDIEWINDAGEGFKLATDEAYVVVINETNGEVKAFDTGIIRSLESATVVMDNAVSTGDVLHAYLSFLRDDGTVVSDNSYAQATI